jgi:hypothetical protein
MIVVRLGHENERRYRPDCGVNGGRRIPGVLRRPCFLALGAISPLVFVGFADPKRTTVARNSRRRSTAQRQSRRRRMRAVFALPCYALSAVFCAFSRLLCPFRLDAFALLLFVLVVGWRRFPVGADGESWRRVRSMTWSAYWWANSM